jgi:hypothetical protein
MEGVEVTQKVDHKPQLLLTSVEEEVLRALTSLPPGFEVASGERLTVTSRSGDTSYSYEPDIVVTGPDGKQVILECKSSRALSVANLARLLPISDSVRARGYGFLLLVNDDSDNRYWRTNASTNFEKLHIKATENESDVVKSVLEEFQLLQG